MIDLQTRIQEYLKERGWQDSKPDNIAKSIIIEGAELLEHFQWGAISKEEIKKDKKKYLEIQEELADVFIYCLDMACILDLDAEKIILQKLQKVKKKYPAKVVKKNQDNYLKIKKEYRKNKK